MYRVGLMRSDTKMKMMIDSNIWISGFLFQGNEMQLIIELILRGIEPSICITIINELDFVFSNKFKIGHQNVGLIIDMILSFAEVEIEPDHLSSLNEHDIRIMKAADINSCDYLITGDKYMLEKRYFNSTEIVSTREGLSIIERCCMNI